MMNTSLVETIFRPFFCLVDAIFIHIKRYHTGDIVSNYFRLATRVSSTLIVLASIVYFTFLMHLFEGGLVVYVLFWVEYILLGFAIGIVQARYKDESNFDKPEFIIRKPGTAITILHLTIFFVVFTSPAWYYYVFGF